MYDFISGAYGDMQGQMNNDMVKSPEFMDRFNMYGDAMNTYNDYQSEQEKQNQLRMPGDISQQIIGPDGNGPCNRLLVHHRAQDYQVCLTLIPALVIILPISLVLVTILLMNNPNCTDAKSNNPTWRDEFWSFTR